LSVKVVAAINDLNRDGHCARLYKHDGKVWVEIDQCMLASFAEIEGLVDGVHSFEELAEVLRKIVSSFFRTFVEAWSGCDARLPRGGAESVCGYVHAASLASASRFMSRYRRVPQFVPAT